VTATARRILAAAAVATVTGAAGYGVGHITTHAPRSHAGRALHSLMGSIVHGGSFTVGIDGRAYVVQAEAQRCQREWGHGPGHAAHWARICRP
jgi:hypothetical protein